MSTILRVVSNWKLWFSMGFFLLVATFFMSYVDKAQAYDDAVQLAKTERITALAERKDATAERLLILKGLNILQEKNDRQVQQNKELLLYLRSLGIAVPSKFIAPENRGIESKEEKVIREIRKQIQESSKSNNQGKGNITKGGGGSDNGGSKSGNSKDKSSGGNSKSKHSKVKNSKHK